MSDFKAVYEQLQDCENKLEEIQDEIQAIVSSRMRVFLDNTTLDDMNPSYTEFEVGLLNLSYNVEYSDELAIDMYTPQGCYKSFQMPIKWLYMTTEELKAKTIADNKARDEQEARYNKAVEERKRLQVREREITQLRILANKYPEVLNDNT